MGALLNWLLIGSLTTFTAAILLFEIGFDAILSSSMAPAHPAGSVVVTFQIPTSEIKPGHVIKLPLPNSEPESYVHRVISAFPAEQGIVVVTKGDGNAMEDPWSLAIISTTTPVVVATLPFLGFLSPVLSQFWIQLSLALIVLASVSISMFRFFGTRQRRAKKIASEPAPEDSLSDSYGLGKQ